MATVIDLSARQQKKENEDKAAGIIMAELYPEIYEAYLCDAPLDEIDELIANLEPLEETIKKLNPALELKVVD